jgi:hypothetical protein
MTWSTTGRTNAYVRYLHTMRQLYADYATTSGLAQQQVFIQMIHVFMQQLCSYPPATYVITTAAYRHPEVGGYPHVVPVAYDTNTTLWYFTPSPEVDDVQDLWVKQAQVYLAAPRKDDVVLSYARTIVYSNFFVIDGAHKDPTTSAWHPWSVMDLALAHSPRLDLRHLESAAALAPADLSVIHQRLQTLQYQAAQTCSKGDTGP